MWMSRHAGPRPQVCISVWQSDLGVPACSPLVASLRLTLVFVKPEAQTVCTHTRPLTPLARTFTSHTAHHKSSCYCEDATTSSLAPGPQQLWQKPPGPPTLQASG